MRHLIISAFMLSAFSLSAGAFATADEHSPLIDEPSGIAIPTYLTDDYISTIDTAYYGGWEYSVGGGVAAFDCNDDDYPELYVAGGQSKAALYINQSGLGKALIFSRSSQQTLQIDKVIGAYPIDINADGMMDLMTLRMGENILFKGLGNCEFERANEQWNFDGGDAWSTAFSATWEAGQKWPTLAIGNYLDRKTEGKPAGRCDDNKLFRPAKNFNTFGAPQKLGAFCTLSLLFSDWDRSGKQALRVSHDGWEKLNIWGMGIANYDVDGDGYSDYFLTSMGNNNLQMHIGDGQQPTYKDMAVKLGITAHKPWNAEGKLLSTAWHAQFADVNNDGLIDLFISKGNVDKMPDFARNDPNNLLLQQLNGQFFEAAGPAGLLSTAKSRGALVVDLNVDGLLDIVHVVVDEGLSLFRNLGTNTDNIIAGHDDIAQSRKQQSQPLNNWLSIKLNNKNGDNNANVNANINGNINAIGAWIEVKTGDKIQRQEVTIGGGHASGMAVAHHFGIGTATTAQVRVEWPLENKTAASFWSEWLEVKANHLMVINKATSGAILSATMRLPPTSAKPIN